MPSWLRTAARSLAGLCLATAGCADGSSSVSRLVLGTTHTIEDSGLLTVIDSLFRNEHGEELRLSTVVAGSGEVLALARRRDVDVVLSHSPDDEAALLSDGAVESREPVMYNEFVLLGPAADPAGIRGATSAPAALRSIEAAGSPFISRGDGSGTHRRELALWAASDGLHEWASYFEAGAGMADALRVASQRAAYILSDRATFEMLRAGLELEVLVEDSGSLLNQYSVLVVNEARNIDGARRFAEWVRGSDARQAIAEYGRNGSGRPLFTPGAPAGQ